MVKQLKRKTLGKKGTWTGRWLVTSLYRLLTVANTKNVRGSSSSTTKIVRALESIFEGPQKESKLLKNVSFQATSTPSNSIMEVPSKGQLISGKKNILVGLGVKKVIEPKQDKRRNVNAPKEPAKSKNDERLKLRSDQALNPDDKGVIISKNIDDDVILIGQKARIKSGRKNMSRTKHKKRNHISINKLGKDPNEVNMAKDNVKTSKVSSKTIRDDLKRIKKQAKKHKANGMHKSILSNKVPNPTYRDPLDLLGEPEFFIFKKRINKLR